MDRARHIARAAAQRRTLRTLLGAAGPLLSVAAGIALVIILADRLIGPGLSWELILGITMALSAVIALAIAFVRRSSALRGAVEVDTILRLQDRIGTALALESQAELDPFARLAVDEGERAASQVRLARAVPISLDRTWIVWPVLACMAAAIGYFVEPLHLLNRSQAVTSGAFDQVKVNAAVNQIQQAADLAKNAEDPAQSEASDEPDPRTAILDQLVDQIERGTKTPEEAMTQAAGVLEDAASKADLEAQKAAAEADKLKQALSEIPPESTPPAGQAEAESSNEDSIRGSMRRGDLAQAATALEALEEQMSQMPESQRQALTQDLEQLATEIDEAARKQREEAKQREEESIQRLADQGIPEEQARELQEELDRQQLEKQLREKGLDEESARRLAEEMAKENLDRQAQESAADRAQELSEAAREAAEDLKSQPEEKSPEQQNKSDSQNKQNEQGQQGEKQDQSSTESKPQSKEGQSPSNDPQDQQQQQQQQQPNGEQKPSPQGEPGEKPEGDPQQQQNQQGTPSDQPCPNPQPSSDGSGTPSPSSSGSQPSSQPGQSQQPGDSNQTPGGKEASKGTSPQGGQQGQKPQSAMDRLQDQLRNLGKQQEQAREQERRAQEMRDQARDMLEQAAPDRQQNADRWAQHQQKQENQKQSGNGPGTGSGSGKGTRNAPTATTRGFTTEEVDARKQGEDARVAAEWTRPGKASPDRSISRREMTQQLVEAREAAEQAVEEQVIPARYKNVQEFYRRALQQAEKSGTAPTAPAPPAEPAPAAPDAAKPAEKK